MIKIAPSILSADFANLGEQVKALTVSGADVIHVDVMDGHFVPNITIGPQVLAALRQLSHLPFDVHLMISNPDNYLEKFAEAGADYLVVHWEACTHLHRTLSLIMDLGKKTGVALNPHTPASFVEPVLHLCNLVLVMSVNPGFAGQRFIPQSLEKIATLKQMAKKFGRQDLLIQVDGGINRNTAPAVVEAGANFLVAGSAIFEHPQGIKAAIEELRNSPENV